MGAVEIVAEVGSNYDGSLEKAQSYVKASKECGADAIKYQTIRKDRLVAPKILSDGRWVDNPVYREFGSLELADEWHHALKRTADQEGIEFISTPFYLEAVELLEAVGVRTYKIASGDITFFPLLEAVGGTGKRILLSTGASYLREIEEAINVLVKSGAGEIVLLHCVSNYPPRWDEMNLKAMVTMKETFGLPVGISDHSRGNLLPVAAVALGGTVIEKHITFDRSSSGPDHSFATTVDEFADMVKQVRCLELALGTGEKLPSEPELARQALIRRSPYHRVTYEPTDDPNGIWLRPEVGPSPHGRPRN